VTYLEARDRPVFRDEAAMRDQWTAERVTMLKQLWASGISAGKIAAQLGGVSRSAVLGKLYRLQRRADNSAAAPKQRPRRRKAEKPPQRASCQSGKGLLELSNNCCRWPIGRRGRFEILFCGVPEADLARGMPYCARHARRAYRIPPKIVAKAAPKPVPADAAPTKKSRRRRRRYVWRAAVRHPAPRFR
jgi:GcrA cell cycle regulator